jgi:hypothetical protein
MFRATFTALAVLSAYPAAAQDVRCAPAPLIMQNLAQNFGESVRQSAPCVDVVKRRGVCQIWRNDAPDKKTWTWLFFPGDGTVCIMADGRSIGDPA